MATAVFTGADIAFVSATADPGSAGWVASAAAWTITSDVNGDSGVVANVPASNFEGITVDGSLVDDASIPPDVRISTIQIEFDWHIINTGGTAGTNPRPTSQIKDHGTAAVFDVVVQAANSDTTGHFDYTYVNAFTYFSGAGTRAALFAAMYGFSFQAPQRDGANTSRVVVSNFTVTVQYVNIGTGSWLIRTAEMANATGSVDFVTFFPDIAQIQNPSQSGTIDVPIADVAGAYIYVDGGATPVAVAGLPAGFLTDSDVAVHITQSVNFVGDSIVVALAPLVNITIDTTDNPAGGQPANDFYVSGMNNAELAALVGQFFLATMTTGADPTVALFRLLLESDASSGWNADLSVGIWGSYTISSTPSVISVHPPSGSILGGQAVTITGEGFLAATGVEFGGTAVFSYAIVDDTTITAVTAAHASGLVDVEVLSVATGTGLYTYVIPRVILPPIPTRTPIMQGGPRRGR